MNELLDQILDTLIPPSTDGRMPGAGTLALAAGIRAQLSESEKVLEAGLAAAEAADFGSLDLEARIAFLRDLDHSQPAFLATLFPVTCVAYYQHGRVREGLGLQADPPYPRGYDLEPGSLEALDRVRERGPLYRPA